MQAIAHKLPRVSEFSTPVLFNTRRACGKNNSSVARGEEGGWRRRGPCIRLGHRNYSSRARENRVGTQLYVPRRPNANFAFVDPARYHRVRAAVYEKNVSHRKSVVHESLPAIKGRGHSLLLHTCVYSVIKVGVLYKGCTWGILIFFF